jgi:ribosome modulation factor
MINELEGLRLQAAQEHGVLSGLELSKQAADCPFDHKEHALRSSWLLGFSIGRSKRRASKAGSFGG